MAGGLFFCTFFKNSTIYGCMLVPNMVLYKCKEEEENKMTKRNMMKAAHAIAQELVDEVGDYQIALSIALKEVWRQVKLYDKKRFGDLAVLTAAQQIGRAHV